MSVLQAVAVVAGAGVAALLFYPVLSRHHVVRLAAFVVLSLVVAGLPFLIPAEERLLRLFVGAYAAIVVLKMWDVHIGAGRGHIPGPGEYLAFVANGASLVLRRTGIERQPSAEANLKVMATGLATLGAGAWVFFFLVDLDWSGSPLILEHFLKTLCVFVFITGMFTTAAALVRLAGGYAVRPTTYPLLARTPAHFWRGFNRVVGEFLREDVFKAAGLRRRPVLATLLAFSVSALIHEYAFSVAVGRVEGYQTAFFLLQGAAVAGSLRWNPGSLVGRTSTLVFNVATSMLFMASFESLAPDVFIRYGLPSLTSIL